jgi:transmembrane protein 231
MLCCRPSTSETLKWGWVQFVCALWALWWLLSWLEGLVFAHRVLETRVITDLQPRQQRY